MCVLGFELAYRFCIWCEDQSPDLILSTCEGSVTARAFVKEDTPYRNLLVHLSKTENPSLLFQTHLLSFIDCVFPDVNDILS